jgi:hypothetical protein
VGTRPRSFHHKICQWLPRALTAAADLVCNIVMDLKEPILWTHPQAKQIVRASKGMRWIGDGASRESGGASFATVGLAAYPEERGEGGTKITYCCVAIGGVLDEKGGPAWLQELRAVGLALRWHGHLCRDDDRPKVLEGGCSDAIRGMVETALNPWTGLQEPNN